jgi:hypothetical protein
MAETRSQPRGEPLVARLKIPHVIQRHLNDMNDMNDTNLNQKFVNVVVHRVVNDIEWLAFPWHTILKLLYAFS